MDDKERRQPTSSGTMTTTNADQTAFQRVAHELRTPLTSVLGLLSLLEDGSLRIDDDEARELASLGRQEAEQMLDLVDGLVVGAKIARGALDPTIEAIDLQALTHEVLRRFPDVASRTFIPIDRTAVAHSDGRLVRQILTNLFQNVQRYAPDGAVEVRFEHDGDAVTVHVSDSGPGIAAADAERVFSDPGPSPGLGVGLGLSRDLARLLQGDLVVAAEPLGTGATLSLTLPRSRSEATPIRNEERQSGAVTLPAGPQMLVAVTHLLTERDLDRMVAGIHRILSEHLDAESGRLLVRDRNGEIQFAGGRGHGAEAPAPTTALTRRVLDRGEPELISDLENADLDWYLQLGSPVGLFLPIHGPDDEDTVIGLLAVGLAEDTLSPRALEIATAMARLAGLALERARLSADADYERRLRSSVLEALPIAVSVFTGDPPRVVDMNRRERQLLGIEHNDQRPSNLAVSQRTFDVRFADGTPLDLTNSPVAKTIASGESTGPFFVRVTRADGSQVLTRTYCAPFFDKHGCVIGAAVTAEEVDESEAGPATSI
ncbi:MAG: ATP-binding protein [Acidimicrobiia bacterium]